MVAYSGGLDSHVLLHALVQLRQSRGFSLRAAHVHHGLQPAADNWARHCERTCADLGVAFITGHVRVDGVAEEGMEAAARRARYACLAHLLEPGEVLLTAHHQDDQAETLLLQLLRGTGVHGLAGMPALAPFAAGFHARPLLGFPRVEFERYARAQNLSWIEDPSNRALEIGRNLLRHRILPVLRERWPTADRQLAQATRHAAEAAALLDELARADLAQCTQDGGLRVSVLQRLSPARQRNALRCWIRTQGFRVPSTKQLELLLAQLESEPRTRHATVRWRGAELRRYRDSLVLREDRVRPVLISGIAWDGAKPLLLPAIGRQLRLVPAPGQGIARARLDGAAFSVRFRQGGEVCQLPGRAHHHKLKKLLQEAGVPPWERVQLPLLFVNDALAAIGDRWVCEPYAAKPDEPGLVVVLEQIAPEGKP